MYGCFAAINQNQEILCGQPDRKIGTFARKVFPILSKHKNRN